MQIGLESTLNLHFCIFSSKFCYVSSNALIIAFQAKCLVREGWNASFHCSVMLMALTVHISWFGFFLIFERESCRCFCNSEKPCAVASRSIKSNLSS